LMVSDVPYPAVPKINFRTARGILGAIIVASAILGLIFLPKQFFFPVFLGYVVYGAGRFFFLGLLEREPRSAPSFGPEESPEIEHIPRSSGTQRAVAGAGSAPEKRRRKRRRRPPPPTDPGREPP